MSVRVMAGAVAAAGLLVAACAGDDGGGGGQLTSGDEYTVLGALAELPASLDTSERRYAEITTGDLTAATAAADLERPDDPDDEDAVTDWLVPLAGGRHEKASRIAFVPMAEVFGLQRNSSMGEIEDELGWSMLDAASFVEYAEYTGGVQRFSVISGAFDDETLSDDLIELDDGVVTNSERDDGVQDVGNPSAVDMLGRPVRLAQDGERIVSSLETPPVRAWVEAPDETLADDEDLAAVASALDDADVFSAVLMSQLRVGYGLSAVLGGANTSEAEIDARRAEIEEEMGGLPPAAFTTVGIGWGADDDGSVVTIAYQHDSEDDASANAEALARVFADGSSLHAAQPLSELYDVEAIETDGTVAVVTLRHGPDGYPSDAIRALEQRDLPFVHA